MHDLLQPQYFIKFVHHSWENLIYNLDFYQFINKSLTFLLQYNVSTIKNDFMIMSYVSLLQSSVTWCWVELIILIFGWIIPLIE